MATVRVDSPPVISTATRLAYERTRVAYERTMMAWVRTGTSLITFGFSVYKFFQLEVAGKDLPSTVIGSRGFALVLIGIGLLALLLGAIEYRRDMQGLRARFADMPRSVASAIAVLIAVLGFFALLAVIFRG